jgi:hypothetical protein
MWLLVTPLRRLVSRTSVALCAVVLCLASSSACVAYGTGRLPRGGGLTEAMRGGSQSVAVVVRVERTVNGAPEELPDYLRDAWIEATLDAYRCSGLFAEVRRGISSDTDLQAVVRIQDRVVGSKAFGYLSARSWLLLPSRERDQLRIRTIFRNREGGIVGAFRSEETVTTWFQVLLLPLTPFLSRNRVVNRTIRDLSTATTVQARRRGML